MTKAIDEVGKTYGRLTVLSRVARPKGRKTRTYWLCHCECGNYKVICGKNMRCGDTKSCGCLKPDKARGNRNARRRPHGHAAARHLYAEYRSNAKRRGYCFEVSREEFVFIAEQPCHYCGAQPKRVYNPGGQFNGAFRCNGVDRKDNDVGYTVENCVPCCGACNFAKARLGYEAFRGLVRDRYHHWGRLGESELP